MISNIILGIMAYGIPAVLCIVLFAIVAYEVVKLKKSHAIWWALPNLVMLELLVFLFVRNAPINTMDSYLWLFVYLFAMVVGIYSFGVLLFMRRKYKKLKPLLIISAMSGVALLLSSCAPTTGLVQTGTDSYAITQSITRVASPEEKRTMSLSERTEKYMTPFANEVKAQALAKCASENATYEYVTTRIWHPAGNPHYTLNFKCIKNGSQAGGGND